MRVGVGCNCEVAVAEPFLNLLEGDAAGQQEAGAGVPKDMIPYPAKAVFIQKLRERG